MVFNGVSKIDKLYVVYFNDGMFLDTFDFLNRTYTTTNDIGDADYFTDEFNAQNVASEFKGMYKEI
jgi:hypothetical protein